MKGSGGMEYGIWDNTGPRAGVAPRDVYRQHLDELVLAEAGGFAHYWFFEHHLSASAIMPAPNLMIAAAAERTSRIRIGNMVNVLPYHNPLLLAEEIAMLDQFTGGRLDVGIGRGGKGSEYESFGLDPANSRAMFRETIEVMQRIWADETFVHEGRFHKIKKDAALSPPLVQRPHPPLYVTANSEESLRWAAERDLPFVQLDARIEDCRRDVAFYRVIQRAKGVAPRPRLCLTREVYIAPTDAEARRDAKPYLLQYWNLWGRFTQFVNAGQVPASFDSWYQRAPRLFAMSFDELVDSGMVLAGSPESVARQILAHCDALDLAVLVCAFQFGAMPHAMVERSMRGFCEQVMPRVAAALHAPVAAEAGS
jgi:alkanesulfonate monooxygenase SsuD/methylene tetrahydromethanopterin reductase-like flavin-dependent oxidoreductase (luciferase family)